MLEPWINRASGNGRPASRRRHRWPRIVRQEQRRRRGGAPGRLSVLRHRPAVPRGDVALRSPEACRRTTRAACERSPTRSSWLPTAPAAWPTSSSTASIEPPTSTRPPVDAAVSAVSAIPELRAALLAAPAGPRVDGRDRDGRPRHRDGRAARRGPEALPRRIRRGASPAPCRGTRARPTGAEAEAILEALRLRDRLDSTRAVAPLHPAPDARIISTDGNRFEDTVDAVVGAILDAQATTGGGTGPDLDAMTARTAIDELDHAADLDLRVRRPVVLPGHDPGRDRGRDRRDPARGPGDHRRQPRLEPGRAGHRLVADPAARAADPLARQEGAVRLADHRLDRRQRRRPSRSTGAGPTSRRSGWPSGSSTRGTSCSSSPKARAAPTARSRRRATGSRSSRCAREPRSCPIGISGTDRVWPKGQRLPHPGGRVTVRVGRPFRPADELPEGTDRATAKRLATRLIMGRIAAAPAAPPAWRRTGRREGRKGTPCDNRTHGNRAGSPHREAHRLLLRRARGDRQGQGGLARRASRRTPSARSSTTRA